jgi:hypothetical protein
MNKELLYNLQLQAGGSHYPAINSHLQEKFAELIVKECCATIENAMMSLNDHREKIGAEFAAHAIAKQFRID